MSEPTFKSLLEVLSNSANRSDMAAPKRGIEREGLRITADGRLSSQLHPQALGATLTHPHITTDYAETLLEFITPVARSVKQTLAQLADIHRVTYRAIGDELIWPLSMPCYVGDEQDILIAQYGKSHSGRMKNLYRRGLTFRYGGAMQIISGVHFNFSVPDGIWSELALSHGKTDDQEFRSEQYFGLIRNYKRISWLIPYLFGASPAICKSFLKHTDTEMEFSELGKGTLYRQYGTSLRMSDLGYTNKEQADLGITYNSVCEYVQGLRRAISRKSNQFSKIGVKVGNDYRQLNDSVLQIENEFYATIRPKRVAEAGETPTQALERGGVEYIEVRALDVNPFSPVGITEQQVRMLDLMLFYCLLQPSASMDEAQQLVADKNFNRVVMDGRNPRLTLQQNGHERLLADWLEELFADFHEIAKVMDKAAGDSQAYQQTVTELYQMVLNPELTLSGQILQQLREQGIDNSVFGMALAQKYRDAFLHEPLEEYTEAQFRQWAEQSLQELNERESADENTSFDDYLATYFEQAKRAKNDCTVES